MKRIHVREEYCIGCRLCEIHCITQHSRSKKIVKAFRETPRVLPRMLVEEAGPLSFAIPCRHCEDAPCVEACLTGAMHRDPLSGAVLCDEDRCVGCWTCVMCCPFGAVQRSLTGKKAASKCDLCQGRGADGGPRPTCVEHCPNEAIILTEEGR